MKNYCIFGTNPVLLWSKLRIILLFFLHQEGRLEVVQICCIYLCFSRTDSKFLKWLISLNWVNILMLRPILSSFQSNISMTDYELYWWWQWQQNLKKNYQLRRGKWFWRLAMMTMMKINYLGATTAVLRLNKVFKSFHLLPFWQTNACNAEVPTDVENIVKFWFWFNLKFRTTIWPNRELQEGFDLRKFWGLMFSWSCCTKVIGCT